MDDWNCLLTDEWDCVDTNTMKKQINEKGLSALKSICYKQRNDWKNVPLNVAVTGNSGTGKSSFINAILGLEGEDDCAAKVDEVETTVDARNYPHPSNSNLQLWDLPGVGTPRFPKATYLDNISFDRYDFFLILSKDRFTENDMWLATEIHNRQKKFFFVRTKIDSSVNDDKLAHKKTHDETVLLDKIKHDCTKKLVSATGVCPDVFLISNYHQYKFDFRLLADKLIADFPARKREAVVMSLNILTENIIREKATVLRGKVSSVAALCAVGGAIPIHPISSVVNVALIIKEMKFYRKQFGLDDESLTVAARDANMSLDDIKMEFSTPLWLLSVEYIEERLGKITIPGVAVSIPKLILPIVGSIIGATYAFKVTTAFLLQTIDVLECLSLHISTLLTRKLVASMDDQDMEGV